MSEETVITKPLTVKTNIVKSCGKVTDIEQALECADLNFIAEEAEVMGATNGIFAPNHKMIFRADTNDVLGIVGKAYHPIQNSDAMAFMDGIVKKNGFAYTEAISKHGGAITVMTAQSDRPDKIAQGDEVCRQIKLINGFNGKNGFSIEFSMLRLVCTNGMVRSERESILRFKHTPTVKERMTLALTLFDKSDKFHDEFVRMSRILANKAVDKAMVEQFLNSLYTMPQEGKNDANIKKKEIITELFENGMGNKGATLWDLYNGGTEYVDHHHGKDEKRDDYSTFGTGHKLKEKMWNSAIALV